jgi:hypothetical protein
LQAARISSDHYRFLPVEGDIVFERAGVTEIRLRAGSRAALDLAPSWRLDIAAAAEHTRNHGFVVGARDMALAFEASLVWTAASVPKSRRRPSVEYDAPPVALRPPAADEASSAADRATTESTPFAARSR